MHGRSFQLERWRQLVASLGILAVIFWFYIWTVSQALPLPFGTSEGHYPPLTDGFLAGQLSLPIAPHPDLFTTKDVYNDHENRPPFLHDASFYKGKYYVYFGVTPVVLLFLPFRVFSLGNLPESVAVAVFTFATVLIGLLTLSFLRRTQFPTLQKVPYDIYLMLALGGSIPYFLRRPAVYEVAIACGAFCVMVAIYFLVTLDSNGRVSRVRAALASLFLGLAVGARPHLLVVSPLLLYAALRIGRREQRWPSPGEMAALFTPILLVGCALAWYNYARFDSWTEFGRWYQLAGERVRELHFDVRRIPYFSYLYLLHRGRVDLAFPYTHARRAELPDLGGVTVEPAAGLFYTTPILCVLAFLPLLHRFRRDDPRIASPIAGSAYAWAWALVTLALAQVLFLGTFPGATMRYIVDFSPLLMTAAAIVMMGSLDRLHGSRWRLPVKSTMVLLVVLTIFLNVGMGIRGYYDNLKKANPAVYYAIKRPCDRVVDAIVPWIYSRELQALSFTAPGGVVQGIGVPSFWIGDEGAEFELYSRRSGFVVLRTILSLDKDVKDLSDVRLRIAWDTGNAGTVVAEEKETEFVLPVRRGHNRIVLNVVALPLAPESRPRIVLFAGKAWRFSETAPMAE